MANHPSNKEDPIEFIHSLLCNRDFVWVNFVAEKNKQLGNQMIELDQALAISEVLLAAENRLLNGYMDYYGILRVTRFGPIVLEDFNMLTNLLDGRHNRFPYTEEAAKYALQAWSFLSKPELKKKYDFEVMKHENKKNKKSVGGRWKPSEGRRLKSRVQLHGRKKWHSISDKIHGRTASTCRWTYNHQSNMLNKGPLSYLEEERLIEAQRELGNKWSEIALQYFRGRTACDLCNQWHKIMKRKSRQQSPVSSTGSC